MVLNVQTPDARTALDDARAFLRERDRGRANWMIGSHSPANLPDDLLALGLTDDIDPVLRGLVAAREPDGIDRSIEVRRAATRRRSPRLLAHPTGGVRRGSQRITPRGPDHVDAMFEAERDRDDITTYLAYLDGEPVATARATFAPHGVVMNGGSTLPRARGRGSTGPSSRRAGTTPSRVARRT